MRMVDAGYAAILFEFPAWAKWVAVVLALVTVDALFMAWGERRPVAAFAECLVAVIAYWMTGVGTIILGIWGGVTVQDGHPKTGLAGLWVSPSRSWLDSPGR